MAQTQAMTPHSTANDLEKVRNEVESFVRSSHDLILLEEGVHTLDFAGNDWRLAVEFGKLMLEVWHPGRSFRWRVEGIAYRDDGRLGLFVRKPGGHGTAALELRETTEAVSTSRVSARSTLRQELLGFLKQQYPGWQFERVSNRTDREFSFSAWYTRGLARRGRVGWAFLALSEEEQPPAADAALAHGLNWLDHLRETEDRCVIGGLTLFLPAKAIPPNAHRAACLNPAAVEIKLFKWPVGSDGFSPVDLRDFGNVATRLTPRLVTDPQNTRDFLQHTFGELFGGVEMVPDASGTSLRICGLEVGRLEGRIAPQFYWGLESQRRRYKPKEQDACVRFIRETLALRSARSSDPRHELYRLQPERWLESLLVRDVSQLDPTLRADHVHPQVPAFSGGDRGVIDILSMRHDGRLAVIELKLHEEISLPLQGLDYWLRVRWLNERDQFRDFGYFPGLQISKAPPLLYLASPAFRFHSTTRRIIRYLDPSIEIIQVGINQQWREEIKILFRRRIHPKGLEL